MGSVYVHDRQTGATHPSIAAAARAHGVSGTTVHRWLRRKNGRFERREPPPHAARRGTPPKPGSVVDLATGDAYASVAAAATAMGTTVWRVFGATQDPESAYVLVGGRTANAERAAAVAAVRRLDPDAHRFYRNVTKVSRK
jgi:hypothetical protein